MPGPSSAHGAPSVVAIIPARGGSKGIPGKNLRSVGGVPLIVRAVRAALAAESIDAVVVSTDDAAIARLAHDEGAEVVDRPADISGDTAGSEAAILHALSALSGAGLRPRTTVFLQATSPFVSPADLDAAVDLVSRGEADVVFSATRSHAFLWRDADDGSGVVGVNHDAAVRPRRQDRAPEYRETGAFYAMSTAGFLSARHRFFGRVAVRIVPEATAIEIDTPEDLELADVLQSAIDVRWDERLSVDAVVTDFDGVHTDDTAMVGDDGTELVRISRRDGAGVARLRAAGLPVLILSAERHPVVTARARKLGVEVLQGVADKGSALAEWALANGIALDRVAYLGNDLGDLPAMRIVGWPVAVADADPAVRRSARVVLSRRGGDGAVRELADAVLAHGASAPERTVTALEGASA